MIKTIRSIAEIALIAVILFLALRFFREPPPDGIFLTHAQIDSMKNIPPDTVRITEVIIKRDTITRWREAKPPAPEPHGDLNFYRDSLVTEHLAIYINDTVKGSILSRDIGYKLFVPLQIETIATIEITKPVPYPVKEDPKSHILVLFGAGEGLSGEVLYQSKNKMIYGLEAVRFKGQNFYLGKIGITIK